MTASASASSCQTSHARGEPLSPVEADSLDLPAASGSGKSGSATPDPGCESARAELLVAPLVEQMRAAWHQGECPAAEDFLARHPELRSNPQAAVRLIYEEICLRQECSREVASVEVVNRFPQWQAELRFLLDCHDLLRPGASAPLFPAVGETWADFRLLAELGRGTFGRVFLAVQPFLADRPVVLKMTAGDDGEHLSLARLQHTHIMPLYAVHDDPARHLRALCMPYFGGTSLDQLLAALKGRPVEGRAGRDFLAVLDQAPGASPVAFPAKGPARQLLARASYVQAVCWIGACLAEALHYAHERGLVHLDVKPQNVLLTADGQPMLLDFNLAREPLPAGALELESFGGTPEYMSPEQRHALEQMRARLPIRSAVDARSDVYSLGRVLYEVLGGPSALPPDASPPYLRGCNRQVSPGLADLIHRCLAADPGDRYPDAAGLASDLRRQLADLPLRGVANRSLYERWRKWRRRQPLALALAGMLLTLLLAALSAGIYTRGHLSQQLREAETALADGQDQLQTHGYSASIQSLRRGLALAEGFPASGELRQRLGSHLRLAERAQAAHRLHVLTDRIRFLYGIDFAPARGLRTLEAQCRKVWDARGLVGQGVGSGLGPAVEAQIRTDLLDLAILWADLRVRLATDHPGEARQDALRVLAEAEALFGPSVVLARECQSHAEALGRPDLAQAAARRAAGLSPRTAWEHYSLGRYLLRSGKPALAAAEFDRALDLQPQDFWPNFYQGTCAYRLGRYEDAVNAFRVCLALVPESAECFYNRALAQAALGHTERAFHDYDRALQIDPGLAAAALNRGVLHYQAKRYHEALVDLRRALDHGADSATLHYNLALVYLAQTDRGAALASLRRALGHDLQHEEARELYERLSRER